MMIALPMILLLSAITAPGPADVESIPAQPVDGKIRWVFDYAEGKRLAQAALKPMFVVFRCER